jgi:catechol 2,3-dioxygenase-like lactoylglutathione lyase family enzyme
MTLAVRWTGLDGIADRKLLACVFEDQDISRSEEAIEMGLHDEVQYLDSYPVFVAESLADCRDFYHSYFGFDTVFEATWFVLLTTGGERPVTLAFMRPDHPSPPLSPFAFRGDGAFFTLQVDDAREAYERAVGSGLQCDLPLRDEPWGQRRFGVIEPAGVWVDVVEQIEPETGWWDPYVVAQT